MQCKIFKQYRLPHTVVVLYNYENIYNEIKLKWNNEHVKILFLSNFYGKQYIVKTRYFCIFMTKILLREKIYGEEGRGGGGVPIRFHSIAYKNIAWLKFYAVKKMSYTVKYFVNNIQICSEYDVITLSYWHHDLSIKFYHVIIMFLCINLSCEKKYKRGTNTLPYLWWHISATR